MIAIKPIRIRDPDSYVEFRTLKNSSVNCDCHDDVILVSTQTLHKIESLHQLQILDGLGVEKNVCMTFEMRRRNENVSRGEKLQ
jgi:hypothetical protein